MTTSTLPQLALDTIESIRNEAHTFDMTGFTTNRWFTPRYTADDQLPDCNTASCMAGHVLAMRPELAAELLPQYSRTLRLYGLDIDYAGLACAVWARETGQPCLLDFYSELTPERRMSSTQTREDAVAHIRGTHPTWPQRTTPIAGYVRP